MERIPTYRPGIAEVRGDTAWSALEADLLAECKLGRVALLPGKEGLPADTGDPDRRVRAGLIRYLMLGGCDSTDGARPHPKGVQIAGAWIDGVLDLEGCETELDLWLQDCLLPERATLRDARIGALFLPGCAAPEGLNLQRLTTRGDVHMRAGLEAGATVDLAGARIGGQLDCDGGRFLAAEGRALTCDAARIGASVSLRDGFEARAEVSFLRAEIGGQLACDGGRFLASKGRALNCDAARIGADVFLRNGFEAQGLVNLARIEVVGAVMIMGAVLEAGIDLEAARIGHGLYWKEVTGARKVVDLTEARVGSLRDEWESWEGVEQLILDGFRYDRLEGSMSVADRIAWLGRAWHRPLPAVPGAPDWFRGPDFDPQPHVQLASVLAAQGDRNGAARVLVDREARQRRAARMRAHGRMDGTVWAGWLSVQEDLKRPIDFVFWLLAGYGHRPMRALFASLVLVCAASILAGGAFTAGQFAPNSDVVLTSTDWLAAVSAHGAGGPLPLQGWLEGATAQDYETFNRWLYGLDLFIPLDALGQEDAWRPTTGRGWLGEVAFYSRAFFQSAGWIITALAAAVLTGLVGRRD